MKYRSLKFNTIMNVIKIICSIIFPLISFPYAARVLGAENMGLVQFSISFVSFISLISTLGISIYAVREGTKIRDNKEKISIFSSEVLAINILTSILSYFVIAIILIFFDFDRYFLLIILQSLTIIFTTVGMDWLYTIYEDYKYITIRFIIIQVVSVICLFVFVRNPNDYIIYLIINVFATTGACLLGFIRSNKYIKLKLVNPFSILKKHLKQILIFSSNQIAIHIYLNSDNIMLGLMTSDFYVGIYSTAVKIYTVIKSVLSAVITTSIPKLLSLRNDKQKLNELYNKIINYTLIFLIPCLVCVFFLSDEIILVLTGNEYVIGGITIKILSISAFFAVFANLMVNGVLLVNDLEKKALFASVVSAFTNVSINLVAIPLFNQNGAAITTLLSEAIMVIISYIYTKNIIKYKINRRIILVNFIELIIIGSCYYFIRSYTGVMIYRIMSVSGICLLSYIVLLHLLNVSEFITLKTELLNKIKSRKRKI